jgi:peptidoglycan/xylan/chitin deacetylase (PgdA/CDA1 family)
VVRSGNDARAREAPMSNPRIAFRLADEAPPLTPPEGKPLIVHVVVNVEAWAFDAPQPRGILTAPQGVAAVPDVPNWSWAEYGNRAGMPRLLAALAERGIPASAPTNSAVITTYPRLAERMLRAGLEFMGHGVWQRSVRAVPDERAMIFAATEALAGFTGAQPRGWLGPGLAETMETPDLLREAGYDWLCDWVLDDVPVPLSTRFGPMVALPYSLELNDSVLFAVERKEVADWIARVERTIAVLAQESGGVAARVLTLPLHPHLLGVPHRIGALTQVLDLLLSRHDTIFMNGTQIAEWYAAVA